jgi:glutamine synthetase
MQSLVSDKGAEIFERYVAKHPDTKFFRVYWVDFSGRLRTKILTRSFLQELAEKKGSFVTAGSNCMNKLIDTSTSAGGLRCGTDELYPDWETLRNCPHFEGHASLFCYIRHIGDNFESCPRTTLKKMEGQLQNLGLTSAVGIEIEFAVFEGTLDDLKTIDVETGWLDSAVFRSKYLSLLEELVLALEVSGIPVREFHAEGSSRGL